MSVSIDDIDRWFVNHTPEEIDAAMARAGLVRCKSCAERDRLQAQVAEQAQEIATLKEMAAAFKKQLLKNDTAQAQAAQDEIERLREALKAWRDYDASMRACKMDCEDCTDDSGRCVEAEKKARALTEAALEGKE